MVSEPKAVSKRARRSLSFEQVERLAGDNNPGTRAATAAAMAEAYSDDLLTSSERKLAEDILEQLARDVEIQVREAIADHVKSCPFLPHSLALTLAHDVAVVALPVVRYSDVLTDSDLIAIVRKGEAEKVRAVARRAELSAPVSDAVVEHGDETAVESLLENPGADIAEPSLHKAMDRFGESSGIQARMVDRTTLPVTVVNRLVDVLSDELKQRLIEQHHFPSALLQDLLVQGQELAMIRLLPKNAPRSELARLIADLEASGDLTPTFLLRALCCGELDFFEVAMAVLTKKQPDQLHEELHSNGTHWFQELYESSGLPEEFSRAFRIAAKSVLLLQSRDHATWDPRHTRQIVRKIAFEYDRLDPDNLECILSQLNHLRDWTGGEDTLRPQF